MFTTLALALVLAASVLPANPSTVASARDEASSAVIARYQTSIAVGWAQRSWSGVARLRLATLSLAAAVLVAQLGAWRLIGWGFA